MRKLISGLAVSLSLVVLVGFAVAQKKAEPSDSQYIAQALSAAPKSIAKGAAVVRMDESGKMATLRARNNGFSCMVVRQ